MSIRFLLALMTVSATAAYAATAPTPATDEFHFVVLGDSQFDDPPAFNRMIDDITTLRPAFVIQVGDMISGYTDDTDEIKAQWQRFSHQIAPLGDISFLPVAGNHDTYGEAKTPSDTMERIYRETWGQPYYQFSYRNSSFIVLNSDSVALAKGIDIEQMQWLAQILESNTAEHIFVFLHRPPATLSNYNELHALLSQYPVRFVFYGHFHHYHEAERDGIRYVMTNASGGSPLNMRQTGNVDHFLHVQVRDSHVGYAAITANGIIRPRSVGAETNQNVFSLTRAVARLREIKSTDLTPTESGGFSYRLLLPNPTPVTLHAYLQCDSPDGRWIIEPESGTRVTLPAQSKGKAVEMTFNRRDNIPTEGWPFCDIRIPYLTDHGEWLDVTDTLKIVEPATAEPTP